MRPHLNLALLLAVLSPACDGSGGLLGGDDDDATTPAASDDDDDSTEAPLLGPWLGEANGVLAYPGQGSYACMGSAEATVDEDERATGSVDCTFSHTSDICTFSFEGLRVGGGQRDTELNDCFGSGAATHSMWAANGQLYGRVQRLGAQLSVEISWALDPDRDN